MRDTAIHQLAAGTTSLVDAAAACGRAGGFSAAECAPVLYTEYPATSAEDLAAVLAAVWPDQADETTLATALQSCAHGNGTPAYDATEVSDAVLATVHLAHDLYMRDGLLDTGEIPYASGEPFQSPDIVPNPADSTDLVAQWGSDVGTSIVTGPVANRIHVRAWNAYPGPRTGQVFLYYARASLLMSPSIWSQNRIPNENGTNAATLTATASAAPVVGDSAFLWQTDGPPEGDHFCLVAQVVTEFQPDTIPEDDQLESFVEWVRDHPGIAWRNITTVPVEAGTKRDLVVSFHNPEPVDLDFLLSVDCANLPIGTTVSVTCSVAGPRPPIDSTQTITQEPNPTIFVPATLPANFTGILVISVTPPAGTRLPPGMVVTAKYLLQDPPHPALAAKAVPAVDLGVDHPGTLLYLGDYVFALEPD